MVKSIETYDLQKLIETMIERFDLLERSQGTSTFIRNCISISLLEQTRLVLAEKFDDISGKITDINHQFGAYFVHTSSHDLLLASLSGTITNNLLDIATTTVFLPSPKSEHPT